MTKTDYIAAQLKLGKTHSRIIAEQPTETVVGSIRGDNLRNVVAILAGGLQHRLDHAPDSELRTALLTAFKYLALPDYAINLSLNENQDMLSYAVAMGLVTEAEQSVLYHLASYERPIYNITREDFQGEWHELPATDSRLFTLHLRTKAPEITHIVIQAKDQYGDTESDWYHATALHGIELCRKYEAQLPFNGYARKLRWRCEYELDCEVS